MQKLSLTNIEPKEAAIVEPSAPHATTTPITTPAEVENEAAEEVAMAGNGQIMMLRTLLKSRENIAMSDLPGIVSYMRAALNKPDLLELTQLTKAEVEKVIKLLEKQPAKNDASNNA
jgi:hypothetical protein